MHCNKVSFQELLDCFDNDLWNNLENNADNLEHNAEKLQEILNRIMQKIMSIIISALIGMTKNVPSISLNDNCSPSLL